MKTNSGNLRKYVEVGEREVDFPEENQRKCTLYRAYNSDNILLYVGISYSAIGRFSGHKSKSDWYYDAEIIRLEHFYSRPKARRAELDAIRKEKPIYNDEGNPEYSKDKELPKLVLFPIGIPYVDRLLVDRWSLFLGWNCDKTRKWLLASSVLHIENTIKREMYHQRLAGISPKQISIHSKQPENTVMVCIGMAKMSGEMEPDTHPPKLNRKKADEILMHVKNRGKQRSFKEVADQFDISPGTVSNVVKSNAFNRDSRKY